MVQLSLAPARNEKLFSRNYLEDRLPDSQEWEKSEEDARKAWEELKEIYEDEKGNFSNRRNDEEGLRHKFISPILEDVLNYSIEKEKSTFGSRTADYALYKNNDQRSQALDAEDPFNNALGLLEAKAWEKKLEMKKKGGGQLYDRLNPTVQVMEYLYQSEPRWGILTNGKRWRLYNQEASSKMDTYYEVNLITILENDDFKQFKYFYLLFRKEAIEGGEGNAFVDKVREKSNKYARDVGEDLEDNLYKALLWLTKGITDVNTNDVDPEEELNKLQNESLIFLYRLVFLFYVDSREIMPDPAEKGETLYSFPSLVDDVMSDIENGEVEEYSVSYYNQLKEIFDMVNKGSEAQGIDRDKLFVPPYNGKLFSSEEHPFLEENKIRDEYMAKVIELLARDDDGRRIDYSDLSVRHLGGIYEGLLEYELNYASEPKVLEDGKYKKLSDLDKAREEFDEDDIVEDELYLATDEEERKATGSYYTPDYIVEYIVENTVGPKVQEKIEEAKQEAEEEEELDQKVQEKVLNLDILDPAMGSGHFLVEVIDYIASEILEYTEKDIQEVKRDVARRCVYGVDVNNMATELAKVSIWLNTISSEKPLSFLDHHLKTGNSLIGADIFELNRHPEEEEEEREVETDEQGHMPINQFASDSEDNGHSIEDNIQQLLEMYQRIMEMPENQPDDIHEQEDIYHEFRNHKFRQRFDVLADVHTSYYFGNDFTENQYHELLEAMQLGSDNWQKMKQQDWVKNATNAFNHHDNIANQKQFFHWKLEFPEVFFDIDTGRQKQNPGFDAVVGNPPYLKTHYIHESLDNYLRENYDTADEGAYDLYTNFTERGYNLLDSYGKHGYILPNKFFEANYGKATRDLLKQKRAVESIVNFDEKQVFEGLSTYTCLLFLSMDSKESLEYTKITDLEKFSKTRKTEKFPSESFKFEILSDEWNFSVGPMREVFEKTSDYSKLDDISKRIFKGFDTGMADFYVLELISEKEDYSKVYSPELDKELEVENGMIERLLKGKDIESYQPKYQNRVIFFPYSTNEEGYELIGIDKIKEKYPKAYGYLSSYEDELRSRQDGKFDDEDWYRFSNPRNLHHYKKNKVFTPYNSFKPSFCFDSGKFLFTTGFAGAYGILTEKKSVEYEKWLTCILNSSLTEIFMEEHSTPMRGNYYSYEKRFIKDIPIPESSDIQILAEKHDWIKSKKRKLNSINLNIQDYIGNYSDGETLGDICMPAESRSETILNETEDDREGLKVERVRIEEDRGGLVLSASAKYKPEDEDEFDDEEFDRWGYVETDLFPAMRFDVGEKMEALIQEFVPVAVDNGDAGFKKKATSNISLINRIEDIQLPKLSDVEDGLEKFIENKEKAEELEEEIQETDELIDAIVFDLYDLTEEEVETVLDSLDTEEDEKRRILEKLREQRD